MNEPTPSAGGPITVVVTRFVKPAREQDFEAWLTGTIEALTRYPGYQGANIVRPDTHITYGIMPGAWQQAVLDLSSYAGQSLQIKFHATTDANRPIFTLMSSACRHA